MNVWAALIIVYAVCNFFICLAFSKTKHKDDEKVKRMDMDQFYRDYNDAV